MKRILYTICIGSLALALTAQGEEVKAGGGRGANRGAARSVAPKATAVRSFHSTGQTSMRRSLSTTPVRQRSFTNGSATVNRSSSVRSTHVRSLQNRTVHNTNAVRARNSTVVNRERTLNNRTNNVAVNRERNRTVNRNVSVNNNWRGQRFSGRNYAAFRNYHREWHNRAWWRSHHDRIVFVSGGWYYWDSGFWFPAWGYDAGASYPYDGPIYGYNNLPPDQVIVDVQSQLQRDGYYNGPVDGSLGPMTRQAIAAYQADNGLAITSAVDEPTLNALGLS
jgi:hypothetical protein